jgi:hypothetical protein
MENTKLETWGRRYFKLGKDGKRTKENEKGFPLRF